MVVPRFYFSSPSAVPATNHAHLQKSGEASGPGGAREGGTPRRHPGGSAPEGASCPQASPGLPWPPPKRGMGLSLALAIQNTSRKRRRREQVELVLLTLSGVAGRHCRLCGGADENDFTHVSYSDANTFSVDTAPWIKFSAVLANRPRVRRGRPAPWAFVVFAHRSPLRLFAPAPLWVWGFGSGRGVSSTPQAPVEGACEGVISPPPKEGRGEKRKGVRRLNPPPLQELLPEPAEVLRERLHLPEEINKHRGFNHEVPVPDVPSGGNPPEGGSRAYPHEVEPLAVGFPPTAPELRNRLGIELPSALSLRVFGPMPFHGGEYQVVLSHAFTSKRREKG